jgi:hypothetical protein
VSAAGPAGDEGTRADKVVVEYADPAGRSIFSLVYLVRDPLAYTWELVYAMRAERAHLWQPFFEAIETNAAPTTYEVGQ